MIATAKFLIQLWIPLLGHGAIAAKCHDNTKKPQTNIMLELSVTSVTRQHAYDSGIVFCHSHRDKGTPQT